jgi:hypothetical protein
MLASLKQKEGLESYFAYVYNAIQKLDGIWQSHNMALQHISCFCDTDNSRWSSVLASVNQTSCSKWSQPVVRLIDRSQNTRLLELSGSQKHETGCNKTCSTNHTAWNTSPLPYVIQHHYGHHTTVTHLPVWYVRFDNKKN